MSDFTAPSSLGDLLTDTYNEANNYVEQANSMLSTFSNLFFVDTVQLEPIDAVPDDYNNRASYLWLTETFEGLEQGTNRLIKLFNANGLVTPPDYTDMEPLNLWKPHSASLSTYIDSISSNFSTLSTTYNKLNEALEPFITTE